MTIFNTYLEIFESQNFMVNMLYIQMNHKL